MLAAVQQDQVPEELKEEEKKDAEVPALHRSHAQIAVPQAFATAIMDINGHMVLDPEYEATMYIAPHEYMIVIPDMNHADWNPEDLDEEDTVKLFYANYRKLLTGGYSIKDAQWTAMMRVIGIQQGLYIPYAKRAIHIDETIVMTDQMWQALVPAVDNTKVVSADEKLVKLCKRHFFLAMSISALAFFTKGHHFTQSMMKTVQNVYRASFPSSQNPPVDWPMYLRQWIHPFGVKTVYETFCKIVKDGYVVGAKVQRLPNALVIRQDSMPAGMAALGVAYKVLLQMRREKWWMLFATRYAKEIKAIMETSVAVAKNPCAYHVVSGLYGAAKAGYQTCKDAIEVLQPFLLGYIDTMDEGARLREQKALSKNESEVQSTRQQFASICRKSAIKTSQSEDLSAFFKRLETIADLQVKIREEAQREAYENIISKVSSDAKQQLKDIKDMENE